ncbi:MULTISPECIES: hypothetical protein [unclassified Streptomyces]|uniref:hypothetical protein n=1 Tax=unclassified Streptomyces TaxID=2593676 RepID=UPI001489B492|nr:MULTISPECIES: hypothetical protein [unclassified Streptomyces]
MDKGIWLFTTNGEWQQAEDPLAPHQHLDDWNEQRKAAGYASWSSFPGLDAAPLGLEIYRGQDDGPMLLFLVNVTTDSFYETVYAESVPALMELLARWTPVVQGAAIGKLAGEFEGKGVIPSISRHPDAK